MEAKHTPGEWHVHLVDEASVVIPRRPFRQVISVLGGSEVADEMDYANARLIAATPELLELLKVYAAEYNIFWRQGMPILEPEFDALMAKIHGS